MLALIVAACSGDDRGELRRRRRRRRRRRGQRRPGDLSISGVWTGQEARSFQAVLDGFTEQNPNVNVKYNPAGDKLPTVLSTAVEGGNPPDLAAVAQPGLVAEFVEQGRAQADSTSRASTIEENFAEGAVEARRPIDGKLYGLLFKARQQVDVWYNVPLFEQAGVEPPEDSTSSSRRPKTLKASGVPPYSIGGADGWTLTDLFENIYLRRRGPEKYDQLADARDPVDRPVGQGRAGDDGADRRRRGRTSSAAPRGALRDRLPDVGHQRRSRTTPKAAHGASRATSSASVITERDARPSPETDFNVFAVPGRSTAPAHAVVGGGDIDRSCSTTRPAAQALVEYLATPEAAEIWAKRGGFSSAEQERRPERLPRRHHARKTATAIAEAETFRFDMSDLAAGGVRRRRSGRASGRSSRTSSSNPDDVDGTAAADGEGGGEGVRVVTPSAMSGGRRRRAAGAAPPPPAPERGAVARHRVAVAFLAARARPARRLDRLPDDLHDRPELLRPRRVDEFVGLDNYQELFTKDDAVTAIKNNAIWVAVVPALVTAIGLVFAVLTERVRWSVAFKTAVFMPMAISLFAAGVIWRVMYEQDPDRGAVNARDRRGRRRVRAAGVLPDAQPSTRRPRAAAPGAASCSRTRCSRAAPRCSASRRSRRTTVPEGARAGARAAGGRRARSPASCGATSSPAAASPAIVERGELGLPGVTVELRDAGGEHAVGQDARPTTAVRVRRRRRRRLPASRSARTTFAQPFEGVAWLGAQADHARCMIAYIWVWAGFAMVVIAAGLAAIPRDVLEAARTDGATEWQVFRRVTVPLLAPGALGRLHHDADQRPEGLRHRAVGRARLVAGRRERDRARDVADLVRRRERLRPRLGDRGASCSCS